jgi:hypothetical protein
VKRQRREAKQFTRENTIREKEGKITCGKTKGKMEKEGIIAWG